MIRLVFFWYNHGKFRTLPAAPVSVEPTTSTWGTSTKVLASIFRASSMKRTKRNLTPTHNNPYRYVYHGKYMYICMKLYNDKRGSGSLSSRFFHRHPDNLHPTTKTHCLRQFPALRNEKKGSEIVSFA